MGGFIRVLNLYGMHGLTGNEYQDLWDFINENIIHAALNEENKVMIKALHVHCLVD